ncbi:non-specific lipid-transfer protein 2-like [Iris pallida]|uniref:Non-specific lipid-transfer protein 2-like n=1 Tax=Iris pallida TaxID=29817 RepID=A0AAX6ID93_IRIPA|nr:non-specific lipid-transfer protein 2-like [Iris pallida]
MAVVAKLMFLAVAAAAAVSGAQAQGGEIPSCASKLVPCAAYLNATTAPPDACCGPLKQAVKDEMPCLCKLYNQPDLLKSLGINVTQVMGLPKLCGVHSDATACSKTPPPGATTAPTPPATPGGAKKDSSGTLGRATWIGVPGFVSLLVFGWSIVAI